MADAQTLGGLGNGGICQVQGQAGKPLTNDQNTRQAPVGRHIQLQGTALNPLQKVKRSSIVNSPGQQCADLCQHGPCGVESYFGVCTKPFNAGLVPFVSLIEQSQQGPTVNHGA